MNDQANVNAHAVNEHPLMRHESVLKKVVILTAVFGALYLLLGILFLVFPQQMKEVMGVILGIVLIGLGVFRLVTYFKREKEATILATDLFIGIILCLFGIFCIVKRQDVLPFIGFAFGIMLIGGSIIKVQNAIDLRHMGYYRWWILLALGLISAVMGVLLIMRPSFMVSSAELITALFFIYDGVSAIAAVIVFKLMFGKFKKGIPLDRPEPKPAPAPKAPASAADAQSASAPSAPQNAAPAAPAPEPTVTRAEASPTSAAPEGGEDPFGTSSNAAGPDETFGADI